MPPLDKLRANGLVPFKDKWQGRGKDMAGNIKEKVGEMTDNMDGLNYLRTSRAFPG